MHSTCRFFPIIASLHAAGRAKGGDCESDRLELDQNKDIADASAILFLQCLQATIHGKECDTSDFQDICEDEGFDFFTMSGNITCDDDDDKGQQQEIQDVPLCLPKSCTKDEDQLEAFFREEDLQDLPGGGYDNCIYDFDFEGITSASSSFSPAIMTGSLVLLMGVGVTLS